MSVRADAETMRLIPIFKNCDPVPLQIMAFAAERIKFDAGTDIITQGDTGRNAYLLMSGKAELLRNGKTVGIAEEGSFLGEIAMIGGVPYSLTARAQGAVTAARIDNDLFLRVAGEYPEFGQKVLRALAERLDGTLRDFNQVRGLLAKGKSFSDF
jgi:CRP-like cAMP-binding protein